MEKDYNETQREEFATKIKEVTNKLVEFLIQKNIKYGNSVNNPIRVFSSADELEQINIRMDDKLSRLAKGGLIQKERIDTLVDLTGYLLILLYNLYLKGDFDPDKLLTSKHMD